MSTGELEVAGSEAFVEKYASAINKLVEKLDSAPNRTTLNSPQNAQVEDDELEFPETLHQFGSKSGTDQILLAGAFARSKHADSTFSTGDANALLIEQGIKLANASQSMANNLKAKRVFKAGRNWKLSRTGEEYLQSLGVKAPR